MQRLYQFKYPDGHATSPSALPTWLLLYAMGSYEKSDAPLQTGVAMRPDARSAGTATASEPRLSPREGSATHARWVLSLTTHLPDTDASLTARSGQQVASRAVLEQPTRRPRRRTEHARAR